MKKLILLAAVGLGLAGTAAPAAAQCTSPFCGGEAPSPIGGPFASMFYKRPVPAFQAAPWYLYWPYQGHFMTAAPLPGAGTYPGAAAGGQMVNPYFPAGPVPAAMPAAPGQ